jgi:methionyl-tRNA synthetase
MVTEYFESRDFARAIVEIRSIADDANHFFDQHEPWKLVKTDPEKTRAVLTTILNMFRLMAIYLKPIIPSYSENVAKLFNEQSYTWSDAQKTLEGASLQPFQHLAKRIETTSIEAMVEDTKRQHGAPVTTAASKGTAMTNEITIDDFTKVDLRIGKITDATAIPEAEKLLKLSVDLGTETRTIFSGIKAAYTPESLVGKYVAVVANLKPRKMKFGVSEGMILASGDGKDCFLLTTDPGAKPGDKIT